MFDGGDELRDRGIRQAEARDRDQWDQRVIRQAITEFARRGQPFSASDLRELLPDVNGQLIGAGLRRARQRGLIEPIGTAAASHPEGHRRLLILWRGTAAALSRDLPAPVLEEQAGAGSRSTPRNGREPVEAKASRLLLAGAVSILRATEDTGLLVAQVAGDTSLWRVVRQPTGAWRCSCPAGQHRQPCAHVAAVRLVAGAMP